MVGLKTFDFAKIFAKNHVFAESYFSSKLGCIPIRTLCPLPPTCTWLWQSPKRIQRIIKVKKSDFRLHSFTYKEITVTVGKEQNNFYLREKQLLLSQEDPG